MTMTLKSLLSNRYDSIEDDDCAEGLNNLKIHSDLSHGDIASSKDDASFQTKPPKRSNSTTASSSSSKRQPPRRTTSYKSKYESIDDNDTKKKKEPRSKDRSNKQPPKRKNSARTFRKKSTYDSIADDDANLANDKSVDAVSPSSQQDVEDVVTSTQVEQPQDESKAPPSPSSSSEFKQDKHVHYSDLDVDSGDDNLFMKSNSDEWTEQPSFFEPSSRDLSVCDPSIADPSVCAPSVVSKNTTATTTSKNTTMSMMSKNTVGTTASSASRLQVRTPMPRRASLSGGGGGGAPRMVVKSSAEPTPKTQSRKSIYNMEDDPLWDSDDSDLESDDEYSDDEDDDVSRMSSVAVSDAPSATGKSQPPTQPRKPFITTKTTTASSLRTCVCSTAVDTKPRASSISPTTADTLPSNPCKNDGKKLVRNTSNSSADDIFGTPPLSSRKHRKKTKAPRKSKSFPRNAKPTSLTASGQNTTTSHDSQDGQIPNAPAASSHSRSNSSSGRKSSKCRPSPATSRKMLNRSSSSFSDKGDDEDTKPQVLDTFRETHISTKCQKLSLQF